nr:hypothetical protein [Tanacetum cinerariifolium]
KLLKDLKELAEYDQSISMDRPIFLNDNEDHPVQNRESPENSYEENVVSKTNQEPPQDSNMHQLIEECSVEVLEEQKQNIEKTMHDCALDSKLLLINSINSQCLDKKEQEVKIVEEQPAERRNLAPILSTKEPENSLSMGYEHLSITLETESDEVTESNAKNLLPIPSECEVTLEDKRECDELTSENSSTIDVFPDSAIVSVEEENDVHREEEEVDLEDISQVQDVVPQTRSGNTTHANYSLPEYDSFCFEIEPDQERLINFVENDNSDLSNDLLLEEVNLFLSDDSIPPGIENVADDPEGDIQPPDDNFDLEPEVTSAVMEDIDEPDEYFNPGGEIFVSTNNEDVDYFPFMFVIRIFLSYLILPEISPLFLSAESEDTIFDPGLSPMVEAFLCRIYVRFPRSSYPLIDFSLGRSISVIYIA